MIKSIPTTYDGVKFKSKLEAAYATIFNAAEIEWEYENQGFDLEGIWYLPDFWLPGIRTFFEVKGSHGERIDKTIKLAEAICEEDFAGLVDVPGDSWSPYMERLQDPTRMVVLGDSRGRMWNIFPELYKQDFADETAGVGKCYSCGKYYFFECMMTWTCRACGYYDGDSCLAHNFHIESLCWKQLDKIIDKLPPADLW